MFATLVIVLREMIEAGMVIGIVMAATRGLAGSGRAVGLGVLAGLLGACAVAAGAGSISALAGGTGQELFNASVLITAVFMLLWHQLWMSRHGRELVHNLRSVSAAVACGEKSLRALTVVVAAAVLREGSEVVLFLYGVAASGQSDAAGMLSGGAAGLALGALLSWMIYRGLLRIPVSRLFAVTGALLALLAAGMAAQAVFFLQQSQWVTMGQNVVWDTSGWLSDDGVPGVLLHALAGYTSQPTALQVAVYAATVAGMLLLPRLLVTKAQIK